MTCISEIENMFIIAVFFCMNHNVYVYLNSVGKINERHIIDLIYVVEYLKI